MLRRQPCSLQEKSNWLLAEKKSTDSPSLYFNRWSSRRFVSGKCWSHLFWQAAMKLKHHAHFHHKLVCRRSLFFLDWLKLVQTNKMKIDHIKLFRSCTGCVLHPSELIWKLFRFVYRTLNDLAPLSIKVFLSFHVPVGSLTPSAAFLLNVSRDSSGESAFSSYVHKLEVFWF